MRAKTQSHEVLLLRSNLQQLYTHMQTLLLHKMLQMIGLGLADETDVSVKGLELIKRAERVYLEAYTSILLVDVSKLVGFVCLRYIRSGSPMSQTCSRKLTMAAPSLSRTVNWLSPGAKTS